MTVRGSDSKAAYKETAAGAWRLGGEDCNSS